MLSYRGRLIVHYANNAGISKIGYMNDFSLLSNIPILVRCFQPHQHLEKKIKLGLLPTAKRVGLIKSRRLETQPTCHQQIGASLTLSSYCINHSHVAIIYCLNLILFFHPHRMRRSRAKNFLQPLLCRRPPQHRRIHFQSKTV